jgi:ribulose-phosphate 3-epimerase
MYPPNVIPSVLAADWSNIQTEIQRSAKAAVTWLHLDVMDGHFVDNISFGPQFIESIRTHSQQYLDVHLMIQRPDHYLERFIKAGADNITIHVEANYDSSLIATLEKIRAAGKGVGIAINPHTPFDAVIPYLHLVDLLLIMTVVPGFGGQAFMESETMPKLDQAVQYRLSNHLKYHIQVDGGINKKTIAIAHRHGADLLVCGSATFPEKDLPTAMQHLYQLIS